uniref:Small-subunit processome Utp12 domain-containing protein n=1 Tax=Craspedostauros australis TaxID=1486917 RepID=A0A7R9ZIX3_9STRA|mmetsp:Transcript_11984/g.32977  ORF Transcript_11984/g.32977 Transcript_11984/m.32977 type:complete len:186 (+) Transcript_11984:799-1356(+)
MEGLHVYSLDDDMMFDPISLTEDITPSLVERKIATGDFGSALMMALHLNEYGLVRDVLDNTPFDSIQLAARGVHQFHLERLMQFLTKVMSRSPHIEFYLEWCTQLLHSHGLHMERHRGSFMRSFRALHKAVQTKHDELKTICDENRYNLEFVQHQAALVDMDSGSMANGGDDDGAIGTTQKMITS